MMDKPSPADDSVFMCISPPPLMFREPLDGINSFAAYSVGARGTKCAALDEATELFDGCYFRFGTCHSPWNSYIADTKDLFVYELYYRYNSVLIPHILLYRSLLSAVYGRTFLYLHVFQ
jgi:hypothetical protein